MLGYEDHAILAEDGLGAQYGIKRAKARVIAVDARGRHAGRDERIAHIRRLVIAAGGADRCPPDCR